MLLSVAKVNIHNTEKGAVGGRPITLKQPTSVGSGELCERQRAKSPTKRQK